jgi:hypothetical protein
VDFLLEILMGKNRIFQIHSGLELRPGWNAGESLIAIVYRFLCSGAVKRLNCLSEASFQPSAQRNLEPVRIVQSVNCIPPRPVMVSPIISKIYLGALI